MKIKARLELKVEYEGNVSAAEVDNQLRTFINLGVDNGLLSKGLDAEVMGWSMSVKAEGKSNETH